MTISTLMIYFSRRRWYSRCTCWYHWIENSSTSLRWWRVHWRLWWLVSKCNIGHLCFRHLCIRWTREAKAITWCLVLVLSMVSFISSNVESLIIFFEWREDVVVCKSRFLTLYCKVANDQWCWLLDAIVVRFILDRVQRKHSMQSVFLISDVWCQNTASRLTTLSQLCKCSFSELLFCGNRNLRLGSPEDYSTEIDTGWLWELSSKTIKRKLDNNERIRPKK